MKLNVTREELAIIEDALITLNQQLSNMESVSINVNSFIDRRKPKMVGNFKLQSMIANLLFEIEEQSK